MIEAAVTLTDGVGLDDVAAWAGWLTVIGTFLWAALVRPARKLMRAWDAFMDDWAGVPGRPGHDPLPGIPERLQRIEREVQRNGGQSLKDRVFEIDRKLDVQTEMKEREHAAIRRDLDEIRNTIQQKGCP